MYVSANEKAVSLNLHRYIAAFSDTLRARAEEVEVLSAVRGLYSC
jgi:hypothetical protein